MQLSLTEGQRLKREGQETVAENNRYFIFMMRNQAKRHCDIHGQVTTDDLRRWAAGLGIYPTHPNAYGSIFKGKGWTVIGRQPSKLPGNHARSISVWRWDGDHV